VSPGVLLIKYQTLGVTFSRQELSVLKKINFIKFSERTPSTVSKKLTKPECAVLKILLDKRLIKIYKGGKYSKEGVYIIVDFVYPLMVVGAVPDYNSADGKLGGNSPKLLKSKVKLPDYQIITDKNTALSLSKKLEQEIKKGEVIGIKSFDGNFYVVRTKYYDEMSIKIEKCLMKEDLNLIQISDVLKLKTDACKAILKIMNDKGIIIESGTKYSLV